MTTVHTIELPRTVPTKQREDNRVILALVLAVLVLLGAAIAFAPANPGTVNGDAQWIVGP